ncbi:SAM_USH1G_HARP domain-containing protein Sans [Lycorma delicatula]|uniref:SAM_USH1G_HARP domain-containing protein Sans n=1 Tax=Lycorma delicatula TaxID=130591 RepID=UPI003F50E7A1
MSTTRFHKAAQDGMLEILKEATKRDCNAKDEDGMTPTLWAAFEGNLDALRLLVGRGGDPEKLNYHFGQTALHIAAAKGHMNCVSFLVGFGANMWALDHDLHTPMQVAAMQNRREILEYLDKAAAKQEASNKREVKAKKEKAQKDAERHRKKYEERMKKEREKEEKRIKKVEKEYLGGQKIDTDTPIPTSVPTKKSTVEVTGPTFTQIVGTNVGGTLTKKPVAPLGVKKILDRKLRTGTQNKLSIQDNKGDEDKLTQNLPAQRKDAQIIYVNSYEAQNNGAGKRGRLSDVFDTNGELLRSISQPDYLNVGGSSLQEQSSIFDRPGFGSVAFRQRNTMMGTLNNIPRSDNVNDKDVKVGTEAVTIREGEDSSIGSAGSLAKRNQADIPWDHEDIGSSDEENVGVNSISSPWSPLQRFLVAAGVSEYTPQFIAQRIDLEALLMLSDEDMITLGIPMGPRRKLLNAVQERKKALEDPGEIHDSKL